MHDRAGIGEAQVDVLAAGMILQAGHQAQAAAVHELNAVEINDDRIAGISGILENSQCATPETIHTAGGDGTAPVEV